MSALASDGDDARVAAAAAVLVSAATAFALAAAGADRGGELRPFASRLISARSWTAPFTAAATSSTCLCRLPSSGSDRAGLRRWSNRGTTVGKLRRKRERNIQIRRLGVRIPHERTSQRADSGSCPVRPVTGAMRAIPRSIHGVRLAITATARSERRIAVLGPGVGVDASCASADPARAPSRSTATSCQVPGTPRNSTLPRSSKPVPQPLYAPLRWRLLSKVWMKSLLARADSLRNPRPG